MGFVLTFCRQTSVSAAQSELDELRNRIAGLSRCIDDQWRPDLSPSLYPRLEVYRRLPVDGVVWCLIRLRRPSLRKVFFTSKPSLTRTIEFFFAANNIALIPAILRI